MPQSQYYRFKSYIYIITNLINNKIYIGQSINPIQRFNSHVSDSRANSLIYNAIKKYEKENFSFEILICCFDEKTIDELEKYYINLYNSNNRNFGYNIESGGSLTKNKTIETRQKISTAKIGVKRTPEQRIKMSEYLTGIPKTPEHIEKVKKANTGKKRSKKYCDWLKINRQNTMGRKIKLIDIDTNEVLVFLAIRDAARFIKSSHQNIRSALKNSYTISKRWKAYYV